MDSKNSVICKLVKNSVIGKLVKIRRPWKGRPRLSLYEGPYSGDCASRPAIHLEQGDVVRIVSLDGFFRVPDPMGNASSTVDYTQLIVQSLDSKYEGLILKDEVEPLTPLEELAAQSEDEID